MKAAERQLRIRQLIESRDFLELSPLCHELQTSQSSLRRDLGILERQGVLRRVYGGAIPLRAANDSRFDYELESTRLADEKARIGKVAAGLIQDGETVILDGGSTVAAVAREILGRSLHVVTNSLPIADLLQDARNIELTLTGGYLDPRRRVMLGPLCERMLGAIRADLLIMGIGSVSEAGLSNNNTLLVGSERKMIEISRKVVIVADHTKFDRDAMIPVAPVDVADVLVSDHNLAPEHQAMLRAHNVNVLLA